MALLNGADSVSASALPVGKDWYGGYVGGSWPSESAIVARFPNAKHKSIAVNAGEDADILDVESGDATPAQAPAWVKRQIARGVKKPGVYAPASLMTSVQANLKASGLARSSYVLWVAHWDGVKALEMGCEAKQWGDPVFTGGQWDGNVSDSSFFADTVPADNSKFAKAHYAWFDDKPRKFFGKRRVERSAVMLYDKLRAQQTKTKHPHRVQLNFVRKVMRWFANRVYKIAHSQPNKKTGKPSWGQFHRGWRYQQLCARARGERVV